jgi:putative ABC transport system permease protein
VFVRPVGRGSYLRDSDVDTRRRVAVIGPVLASTLFDGADPLGRNVAIGGVRFRVIGVFEALGGGAFGANRDSDVHIPVTAAQRLFDDERIDALAVKAPTTESIDEVGAASLAYLESRYPGEEFSAVTQDQILGTVGASSACSPPCWPRSPRSACWWAASGSATSCW